MHFGEIDLACSVIKKVIILIKYPQIQKSIVLSLLFFLVGSASYGSTIIGVNPLNGLLNQWWKIMLVSSKYKSTTTIPIFFPEEDLDSDNDGIPNSLEDQECLSIGLNYEFYEGIPTGPRH